jgi:cell division protein FtsZ
MLPYPKSDVPPATLPARIIGIGNAGVQLCDRLAMALPGSIEMVAMNSDAQSLTSSVSTRKSLLGQRATRGLGAGGDPEVGFEAARESIEEIRFAVEGASTVILLTGLGGGTGSGATPVIAEAAREAGAFVLALVTTPFSFEGRRRASQATEAETALLQHAHAVIRFENDRMADLSSPRAGIEETFEASDYLLSACVAAFLEMLSGRGPMPVTLGNLMTVLRGGSASALFGRGESQSDNRAFEAVERALKSPLLDRGRMLDDAHSVIVHIGGPPSLSFSETSAIMHEVAKHVPDDAHLFLSVSTVEASSAPLTVTILGNHVENVSPARPPAPIAKPSPRPFISPSPTPTESPRPAPAAKPAPRPAQHPASEPPAPHRRPVSEDDLLRPKPPGRLFADDDDPAPAAASTLTSAPVPAPSAPSSDLSSLLPPAQPPKASAPPKKSPSNKAKQETLQFEPAARGRFEKSEPTIVEGEDLDVPTFLRARQKS